jgi:hypothetical protein
MPSIAYGTSAYRRSEFPELRLVNMFVEKAATSESQIALISRPGLVQQRTVGTGPIRGMFSQAGTFGADLFSVSADKLYRNSAALGRVIGSGTVSSAGGYNEVCVTAGELLYSYNGTDLADTGFTGIASNNVAACCFINSSFVAIEKDSARYFWSDALDGRTWDPTNFITAEREPDNLLDVAPLGNNLWLFGEQSVEVHSDTGGTSARFVPIETLGYNKGIHSTGCVCNADNALFFIGSDKAVYRVAEAPQRVSVHWIEAAIERSSTASISSYRHEGHEFVLVALDSLKIQYDCATQEWSEFEGPIACSAGGLFGTDSNVIAGFGGLDDLGVPLERLFTAAAQLDEPASIDRVTLWANTGATPVLSGQGSNPLIEMRYSRDQGKTWSLWLPASLGAEGQYRVRADWRRLGMFDLPGALFEFRCTDPVPLRISAVKVNAAGGGRSR